MARKVGNEFDSAWKRKKVGPNGKYVNVHIYLDVAEANAETRS